MDATTPSPQDVILYYLVLPPTGTGDLLTKSLRHEFKRAPRDYDGLRHEVGAAIALTLRQSQESVLKAQATVFSDCSFHLEDPDGYRLSSYDPVAEYLRTKISREGRLIFVMRNDLGTQQYFKLQDFDSRVHINMVRAALQGGGLRTAVNDILDNMQGGVRDASRPVVKFDVDAKSAMVTFEDNGRGFDHSRIVTYMCAGWSDKQGIDSVELGCYGIGKFAVLIFGDRMTLIIQAKKAGSHIEHVSVLDVGKCIREHDNFLVYERYRKPAAARLDQSYTRLRIKEVDPGIMAELQREMSHLKETCASRYSLFLNGPDLFQDFTTVDDDPAPFLPADFRRYSMTIAGEALDDMAAKVDLCSCLRYYKRMKQTYGERWPTNFFLELNLPYGQGKTGSVKALAMYFPAMDGVETMYDPLVGDAEPSIALADRRAGAYIFWNCLLLPNRDVDALNVRKLPTLDLQEEMMKMMMTTQKKGQRKRGAVGLRDVHFQRLMLVFSLDSMYQPDVGKEKLISPFWQPGLKDMLLPKLQEYIQTSARKDEEDVYLNSIQEVTDEKWDQLKLGDVTGVDGNAEYWGFEQLMQRKTVFEMGEPVLFSEGDKMASGLVLLFIVPLEAGPRPIPEKVEQLENTYKLRDGLVIIENPVAETRVALPVRCLRAPITRPEYDKKWREAKARVTPRLLHCLTFDPREEHVDPEAHGQTESHIWHQICRGHELELQIAVYSGHKELVRTGRLRGGLKISLEAKTVDGRRVDLLCGNDAKDSLESRWADAKGEAGPLVLTLPKFKIDPSVAGRVCLHLRASGQHSGNVPSRVYSIEVLPGEPDNAHLTWVETREFNHIRAGEVIPTFAVRVRDDAGGSVLTDAGISEVKLHLTLKGQTERTLVVTPAMLEPWQDQHEMCAIVKGLEVPTDLPAQSKSWSLVGRIEYKGVNLPFAPDKPLEMHILSGYPCNQRSEVALVRDRDVVALPHDAEAQPVVPGSFKVKVVLKDSAGRSFDVRCGERLLLSIACEGLDGQLALQRLLIEGHEMTHRYEQLKGAHFGGAYTMLIAVTKGDEQRQAVATLERRLRICPATLDLDLNLGTDPIVSPDGTRTRTDPIVHVSPDGTRTLTLRRTDKIVAKLSARYTSNARGVIHLPAECGPLQYSYAPLRQTRQSGETPLPPPVFQNGVADVFLPPQECNEDAFRLVWRLNGVKEELICERVDVGDPEKLVATVPSEITNGNTAHLDLQVVDDKGKAFPLRMLRETTMSVDLFSTGDLVFENGTRTAYVTANIDETADKIRVDFTTGLTGNIQDPSGTIQVKVTSGLPANLLNTIVETKAVKVLPGKVAKLDVSFPHGLLIENGSEEGLEVRLAAEDSCGLQFTPDHVPACLEVSDAHVSLAYDEDGHRMYANLPELTTEHEVTMSTKSPVSGINVQGLPATVHVTPSLQAHSIEASFDVGAVSMDVGTVSMRTPETDLPSLTVTIRTVAGDECKRLRGCVPKVKVAGRGAWVEGEQQRAGVWKFEGLKTVSREPLGKHMVTVQFDGLESTVMEYHRIPGPPVIATLTASDGLAEGAVVQGTATAQVALRLQDEWDLPVAPGTVTGTLKLRVEGDEAAALVLRCGNVSSVGRELALQRGPLLDKYVVKIEEPENGLDALRAELTLKGALHVGKQLIPLSSDQIVAFSYLSRREGDNLDGAEKEKLGQLDAITKEHSKANERVAKARTKLERAVGALKAVRARPHAGSLDDLRQSLEEEEEKPGRALDLRTVQLTYGGNKTVTAHALHNAFRGEHDFLGMLGSLVTFDDKAVADAVSRVLSGSFRRVLVKTQEMADTVNQRYPGLRLIITDNLKEDMHYTGRTEGEQKYHVQTLGQGMQLAINAFTLPTEYVWLRSQVLHYYLQGVLLFERFEDLKKYVRDQRRTSTRPLIALDTDPVTIQASGFESGADYPATPSFLPPVFKPKERQRYRDIKATITDIEEHQGELKELKRQKEKAQEEYNDAVSVREELTAQQKRIHKELEQIRADLAKIKKRKTSHRDDAAMSGGAGSASSQAGGGGGGRDKRPRDTGKAPARSSRRKTGS